MLNSSLEYDLCLGQQVLLYPIEVVFLQDSQALKELLWVLYFGMTLALNSFFLWDQLKAHSNPPVQAVLCINLMLAELLALV